MASYSVPRLPRYPNQSLLNREPRQCVRGGHKEHQDAQSSDRQLLQEQMQVLIDEQRKLHAELTQIQQQKKPTITSNTSKPVKHTSSCSSSSEQDLAQKVMRSTSVS